MKSTDTFKETIRQYVENDPTIDVNKHENKSIDECVNFILTQVQKSECNGFTDDEIYGLAIHYYDEPNESLGDIKNMENIKCIVNHHVEITEEEKAEMKKEALEAVKIEQMNNLRRNTKQSVCVNKKETEQQLSLF